MSQRTLIVFFSMTGNTEGLARDLAAALPAGSWSLEALREPHARKGWRGIARSVADAIGRRKPRLVIPRCCARDYDVVLLGTPIWMGRISGPARTYLATQAFGSSRLGVFVTSGAPLNAAARRDIEAACPKRPLDVLQFRARAIHDNAKIDAFLSAMGLATSRAQPVRADPGSARMVPS